MITPDEIRLIVEQPSKLGPGRDADEYEMEKFQRVAMEQAIEDALHGRRRCPEQGEALCSKHKGDCRACWREWLEAQ